MNSKISQNIFAFLEELKKNNNKDWFSSHKSDYEKAKADFSEFFQAVHSEIAKNDFVSEPKIYRIHRDLRFSKDKTPYKTHFGGYFARRQPQYRGGYYLHIEPDNCFIGGGFFAPNKNDLYRIRKEIELNGKDLDTFLNSAKAKKLFGGAFWGEELKTAPKGFEKEHPYVHLLKKKQFLLVQNFKNEEIFSPDFLDKVTTGLEAMRPFFDFMTEALTTNLNGESTI